MAYSNPAPAGKHRRPGKHRRQLRAAHQPSAPALMGTAVVASAAAALLHVPTSSASDTTTVLADADHAVSSVSSVSSAATPSAKATGSDVGLTPTAGKKADLLSAVTAPDPTGSRGPKPTFSTPARASRSLTASARTIQLQKYEAAPDWVKPVVSYTLTAGFGESSGLWSHRHTGQDFAAPTGSQVRAIGNGTVVFAQWDGPYGRKIILRHADGTETWYCHLSAFLVKEGDAATVGQVIGLVGSTGNTTGPHLHFEVRPGAGDPIDPMPWLQAHGVGV